MSEIDLTDRHQKLLDYWRSLISPGQAIPRRDAFDPTHIPHLLSFLILADLVDGEPIFRVVGTEMVDAWGSDFTGRPLSEFMSGDYHDFIRRLFDTCVEKQAPVFSHSRFQWDRGRRLDTIRLMVPFARNDDPDTVGHVLVGQSFDFTQAGPDRPEAAALTDGKFEEISLSVLK